MRMHPFVYLEPKTLKEALTMLDENKEKLKIISGGTEIVSLMKLRLIKPQYVMSLKRISNLKGIREQGGKIIIGAATALAEVIESPVMNSFLKVLWRRQNLSLCHKFKISPRSRAIFSRTADVSFTTNLKSFEGVRSHVSS